jgi:hypothetical protein
MLCTAMMRLLAAANSVAWVWFAAASQNSQPMIVDYRERICDCQQYVYTGRGEA